MNEDIRFCKDCEYCDFNSTMEIYYCKHKKALTSQCLVTGEFFYSQCAVMRNRLSECGLSSKLFKKREIKND